jgi:hypothetical protein
MTTATTTTTTTTTAAAAAVPARQVRWTRLGAGMGYTNTEAKRAAIRAAVEAMDWTDPAALANVLDTAPIRFYIGGFFFERRWALHRAAVAPLPDGVTPDPYQTGRLIGLQAVSGERYVLLDLGYEAIDLYHDRSAIEQVTPR